jgi:hypothetical protein
MPPKERMFTKKELLEVEKIAGYMTTDQIGDFFGMSRTGFYNLRERQPEVSERYKKGRAKLASQIGGKLTLQARKGDTASQIFYLKTQCGWREKAPEGENDNVAQALKDLADKLPD